LLINIWAYKKHILINIWATRDAGDSEDESAVDLEELSMRAYSQLTEQQRTALKGRAQLGEVTTINIRLKENKQFKVSGPLNNSYRVNLNLFLNFMNRTQ